MVKRIVEYAEFHLLNPAKIHQGLSEATVMHVGVLLRGAPILASRHDLRVMGPAINRNIVELDHTPEGRAELRRRTLVGRGAEMVHFYYCSLCAGNLTPTQCSGACGSRYAVNNAIAFNMMQPILPVRIAAYMLKQGHRFTVLPS